MNPGSTKSKQRPLERLPGSARPLVLSAARKQCLPFAHRLGGEGGHPRGGRRQRGSSSARFRPAALVAMLLFGAFGAVGPALAQDTHVILIAGVGGSEEHS